MLEEFYVLTATSILKMLMLEEAAIFEVQPKAEALMSAVS